MSLPQHQSNPAPLPPRSDNTFEFDPVADAVAAFANGEFVVVMDDEGRENEGDLVCAASKITVEGMAWFIRHSSGYICISLPPSRLEALNIPMMVPDNQERHKTAYTVTVDASTKHGITTGISASDRATTALKLADESCGPDDFTRPGHMVPLRYTEGGVLQRRGHTESTVDLCKLANLPPAGLLCEIVHPTDPKGSMARRDDCAAFAREWGLKMISVEALKSFIEQQGGVKSSA